MKTNTFTMMIFLLVLAYNMFFPLQANPSDYYVDQSNPISSDQNPGTESQPWKTITKANTTLVAGDTVYIKAGTYSSYVSPSNSGTVSNRITYRNYGTDTVTITGTSYAVYLNGDSYITVDGINGYNLPHFVFIQYSSNYNIIANGVFNQQLSPDWEVSVLRFNSQHNWVHNNTFSNCGSANVGGDDIASCFDIGEYSVADATQYNLIENNTFFHGGHHVIALSSQFNTVRNNYIHNEAWTGAYGNRNINTISHSRSAGRNLIEGNEWGYSATSVDDGPVSSIPLVSPNNIVRYNKIYDSAGQGIHIAGYSGYSNGSNNRIYNNTLFNNGLAGGYTGYAVRVSNDAGQTPTGNVFKNNLYYNHSNQIYNGNAVSYQMFANEYNGDSLGDPLFVNASTTPTTDKTDLTLQNLDLQSNSPAKDKGGPLTTVAAADAGSGTSLIVSDASYFQDGTFAPSGTMQADWIAVGTVSNTVQISFINYSTNTITLANPISRNDGDSVWLYKKSDGVIVLYGTAPDAGAYEVPQAYSLLNPLKPSAPSNLSIF